jgi:hypothetical protein
MNKSLERRIRRHNTSFDRDTGELWVGDVGQQGWEEVDLVEGGDGEAKSAADGDAETGDAE